MIDGGSCDTVQSALAAIIDSQAAAVVICTGDSHDAASVTEYVDVLNARQPDLTVLFANIDDWIDNGVNAYEMNRTLQDKLGIGK